MLSNIYLSQRALKTNSFRTLIVPQPYREGVANIRKAIHGTAMRVYRGLQSLEGPKECRRSLTLVERVKHLTAGLLLLVLPINTLVLLILRKVGVQRAPAYAPVGFISREWVPAPYAAPMLWAIDNREYRVEIDAAVVRRKIEQENRDARAQQKKLYSFVEFSRQIEGLKQVQADNRTKGEISQVKNAGGEQTKVQFLKMGALEAGVADAQGTRDLMEDTYLAAKVTVKANANPLEVKVSAIFDGHGGKRMADFAKDNLIKHLKKRLEEFNRNGLQDIGVWNALKVALVDLSRSFDIDGSGATANVCLQIGRKVWMANVGDSRAILIKSTGAVVQFTEDQKPPLEKYARGIFKRGHFVLGRRLDERLAVARALGDHEFDGGVSARPKITLYELPEDSSCYLLQGCDGIWDVASSDQVGELAHRLIKKGRSLPVVAADIVKAAFQAGSDDNMTVMIRKL